MQKLQAELDDTMPDPQVIPDMQIPLNLKYLNAFIKECERLSSDMPDGLTVFA
jgi:hypothetical protein